MKGPSSISVLLNHFWHKIHELEPLKVTYRCTRLILDIDHTIELIFPDSGLISLVCPTGDWPVMEPVRGIVKFLACQVLVMLRT